MQISVNGLASRHHEDHLADFADPCAQTLPWHFEHYGCTDGNNGGASTTHIIRIHVHMYMLKRQRIIFKLADALIVMDSRLVIRVENMVITSRLGRGIRSGPERRYE